MIKDTCKCGAALDVDQSHETNGTVDEQKTHQAWLRAHAECRRAHAEDECTRAHATAPDVCPGCGGPADNGRNLCDPLMPHYCTRCVAMEAFYNER